MTQDEVKKVAQAIKLFLWARGYSEVQVIEDCRDGHWMLLQLQRLELCDVGGQIDTLATIIVLLERGFYFEGQHLLDSSANKWTSDTTRVVAGSYPSLLARMSVVEI